MKYVRCPEIYFGNEKSLFLAGGISECRDWQIDLIKMLKNEDLVLINPKREFYDLNDSELEDQQIVWEYNHIKQASAVSFWFPNETLCPITLYELGKCTQFSKPLFIGMDQKYGRKNNLEIQLRLELPQIKIVYSLEDLAKQIKVWSRNN